MPRILAAFDKFKDSLDAQSIGAVVLGAYARCYSQNPAAECPSVRNLPLSDGGEGFVKALRTAMHLETKRVNVTGPLGDCAPPVECEFGVYYQRPELKKVAVIEMARASGLELVPVDKRDPFNTTTRGLGQVIMHAYQNEGCHTILLGIGGSATNDGGIGALQAMGMQVQCRDSVSGRLYEPKCFFGRDLLSLHSLKFPHDNRSNKIISDLDIEIASDVQNPFIGENGAVHVFAKQKGAKTVEQRAKLETAMQNLAQLMKGVSGIDVTNMKGAGAAGGVGGGFSALQGACIRNGMDVLVGSVALEEEIRNCDVVFSGEGRFDSQTSQGKVVSMVQTLCRKHHKPLVIICGDNESESSGDETHKIFELLSMFDLEHSMTRTAECLDKLVASKFAEIQQFIATFAMSQASKL